VLRFLANEEAIMSLAHEATVAVGKALNTVHAGADKLASKKLDIANAARIPVASPAFVAGGPLPVSATADGEGVPPRIEWGDVPAGTRSIALVCEDPDAPFPEPYVHWLVYDLAPNAVSVAGRYEEGKNSKLQDGFTGAAPPPGHGVHKYHFQVFALDVALKLGPSAGRGALLDAMRGHVVAWGELVGTYERTS
jgi:Raf kinase inhibitor-like YbhB/YbcL family protein